MPYDVIDDVIMKVGKFIFPVDFVVLGMKNGKDMPIV